MKMTPQQYCDAVEQELRFWNSRCLNSSDFHPARAMFLAERNNWEQQLKLAKACLEDGSLEKLLEIE